MRILNNIVQGHSQLAFLDLEGTQFTHEMIAIGIVKVDIRKDGTIKKIHKGYHSYVYAKNKIGKINGIPSVRVFPWRNSTDS